MRIALVLLATLPACTSMPTIDGIGGEHCTYDGSDSLERTLRPGPDCNGDQHQEECAGANLPSAYGIERGCLVPARWSTDSHCERRKSGLSGCVPLGSLVCCPP